MDAERPIRADKPTIRIRGRRPDPQTSGLTFPPHVPDRPFMWHGSWVSYGPGIWRHRPWWKVAINTILRLVQTRRRPARLLVVVTECDGGDDTEPPRVLGYSLGRVLHL